jgi:hypothetical protein
MDMIAQARAQMLATLFAAFDTSFESLLAPGEKAEGRVVRPPDRNGIVLIAVKGGTVPMAVLRQPAAGLPAPPPFPLPEADEAAILAVLQPGKRIVVERTADGSTFVLRPAAMAPANAVKPAAEFRASAPATTAFPSIGLDEASAPVAPSPPMHHGRSDLPRLIGALFTLVAEQGPEAAALPLKARILINRMADAEIDGDAPVSAEKLKAALALLLGKPEVAGGAKAGDGLAAMFRDLKSALQRQGVETPSRALPPSEARAAPAPRGTMPMAEDMSAAPPQSLAAQLLRLAEAGESQVAAMQLAARHETLAEGTRSDFRSLAAGELPVAFGSQMLGAEFHIERDAQGEAEPGGRNWQARFSIDLPGAGPVHARAGLRGANVAATLWAEHLDTAEKMRAVIDELRAALGGQGLDVLDLRVLHGRPPHRAPLPVGQILQSSA